MTLTTAQELALEHLRSAYIGPEKGTDEVVFNNIPSRQYAVGMLFPKKGPPVNEESSADVLSDVETGDVEGEEDQPSLAEAWLPSSAAVSFVTDSESVLVDISFGTYEKMAHDGPPKWKRTHYEMRGVPLTEGAAVHCTDVGNVRLEIGSRWRPYGSERLVTVHVRNLTEAVDDRDLDEAGTLFQVNFSVVPGQEGRFLEYDLSGLIDLDDESAELRLRYRKKKSYAVGHGLAANWTVDAYGACRRVFLDAVPATIVPAVETTEFESGVPEALALKLDLLGQITSETTQVIDSLRAFVDSFGMWVEEQKDRAEAFDDHNDAISRIIQRSVKSLDRMGDGVDALADPDSVDLRRAFGLAMRAMAVQMRQTDIARGREARLPAWRPFQLGFILVSLASTTDARHHDRELVDLIWFPTGGGKTEAYLGLAAIEMFLRRIKHGVRGGGTAIITRYTLRLLTAQQFQRSAALICAMESLRRRDPDAKGLAPFTIGLWVGNDVTPGTWKDAHAALDRLLKSRRPEEANEFQISLCPWCGTSLVPDAHSEDSRKYGFKKVGNDLIVRCIDPACDFHDELPVLVVDEMIYDAPPTFLLATVDKFARLQFRPEAKVLLGIGTPTRQPSMIIQDELHLLSGPLGTTTAVFDAAIQALLSQQGDKPKIIASTATIRASQEQVLGLYGREVALYPPAGLDEDDNFFSRPVKSGEGRLYVGLMPQSLSQVSALIAAALPLLELPFALERSGGEGQSKDAYWTSVLYHNSLRELGRTATLIADDVASRLHPRARRLGIPPRDISSDRVLELTSRRGADELQQALRDLDRSVDEHTGAVDVVLSSNMLSVGIDIPRLALMLMVGQPKTTSEYIQATSRVGRGETRGIVVTLFRSNRARDRSHYETFHGFHQSLYRSVEPTSVTPWSRSSRERALAGALVLAVRQGSRTLAENRSAGRFDSSSPASDEVHQAARDLLAMVDRSDPDERVETEEQLRRLVDEWDDRAHRARDAGDELPYESQKASQASLLKRFGEEGEGWLVSDSMRSVEPEVAVEIVEPFENQEEDKGDTNQG